MPQQNAALVIPQTPMPLRRFESHAMNNKQTIIIKKVLDEVIEQVERNGAIPPQSESAIRRAQFSSMGQYDKKWEKPRGCIYEGCQQPSIKRSHTIQKSGPLSLIAENRHVLQPCFTRKGKIEMVSVGLNKASVFPGFCIKHEKLFDNFETSKKLDTDRDVVLQCYRTVCRELFRLEFEIEFLENGLEEYIRFREEYVAKRIADLDNSLGVSKVSFSGDSKESYQRTGRRF